ncbi:uncharacterized protein CTHT_0026680 [Thermochaetoides thermophila DSM 1495]|uniref:Metallo-beta-lactamase domain-containing protein n=1 Tax=Chaetomium thermophilum (strain DSM 1495 / CBS 144.50 / IMI 039719) TaxID=759272 RepID=G0S6L9_CHATD|nr:hypothetical protein CTHT_0026680 [Thermochaetoides thermophila DSM 1495]EGS20830.1 hypothetical protein CTHT_0026680 [Thermochaetoides thermophila DSM 1495]
MASFATPLRQSSRSEILEWRFPKPFSHITLTGRSRAAWHTSFVIPQLNLLLDAGLCVNNLRPKHIFLTHGHSDHTLLTPAFVKREDPPDIFCPAEMKQVLDNFINANTVLNLGGLWTLGDLETDLSSSDLESTNSSDSSGSGNGPGDGLLRTHITHPLVPSQTVTLRRLVGGSGNSAKPSWTATAFACDHTVPCLGYVFHQITYKLKPEYRSLSPAELRTLRQSIGSDITQPVATPVFAFLGDTTALTLDQNPEVQKWLEEGLKVVITECSFLREEHRAQAEKTKHTLWADLEPIIRRWPNTTFILMHFSLRYTDEEIRTFFKELGDKVPSNVVVWIDGEGDDEPGLNGGSGGRSKGKK